MTAHDSVPIDLLRGVAVGVGFLLLVVLLVMWIRRALLPRRSRGLILGLALFAIYATATEMREIGRPFVIWRLPLALIAEVYVLVYLARLSSDTRRPAQQHPTNRGLT